MPQRVSAREFIGRLRGAADGRIQQGTSGGKHEILLIVTQPEKAAGYFLAPRPPEGTTDPDEDWVNHFLWYHAFVGEIYRLGEMPVEQRRREKLRIKLPYNEEMDKKHEPSGKDSVPDEDWIYA